MSTTTVAVIGLGIMGGPMAANLVRSGFDVVGYNRSQEAIDKLVAAGGAGATGIADAVKDADVVITMVPDSPDVAGVVQGPDGVFANNRITKTRTKVPISSVTTFHTRLGTSGSVEKTPSLSAGSASWSNCFL